MLAVIGVAGVGQAEVHGQARHDAGRGNRAIGRIGNDGGAEGYHRIPFHCPVGEIAAGLIIEEFHPRIGIEKISDRGQIDAIGLGQAGP